MLGQCDDAVNALNIVDLSLQKTFCQRANQRLPIGRLMQTPIAEPYARGLNNQVALFLQIIERGNDSLTRLAEQSACRLGVERKPGAALLGRLKQST